MATPKGDPGFFYFLGGSTSTPRLVVVALGAIGLMLFVAFVTARLVRARTRGVSIRMQVFLALAAIVGAFAFGLGIMVIDRIEARAVRLATQAAEDEASVIAAIIESELSRKGTDFSAVAGRFQEPKMRGAGLRLELVDGKGTVVFPPKSEKEDDTVMVSVEVPVATEAGRVGTVRVKKPTVVMSNLLTDFAPTVLVISLVLG
ncbi:MAG: hypothetical protein ABW217_04050, partial [Polyangiaceae bacterium]